MNVTENHERKVKFVFKQPLEMGKSKTIRDLKQSTLTEAQTKYELKPFIEMFVFCVQYWSRMASTQFSINEIFATHLFLHIITSSYLRMLRVCCSLSSCCVPHARQMQLIYLKHDIQQDYSNVQTNLFQISILTCNTYRHYHNYISPCPVSKLLP